MSNPCLTSGAIRALLEGRLEEHDRATAKHFNGCPTCQAAAESMIAEVEGELVWAARAHAADVESPILKSWLSQLKGLLHVDNNGHSITDTRSSGDRPLRMISDDVGTRAMSAHESSSSTSLPGQSTANFEKSIG